MTEITAKNEYAWWLAALAGNRGPILDGEPQSGRYRLRNKHKQTGEINFRPVAYWRTWPGGEMVCKVGDVMQPKQRAEELWTYCATNPITNEVYKHAVATGEWPDQHPAAQADRAAHADMANSPNAPEPDSLEAVKDSVENLSREAEELIKGGPAKTKDASDRAADLGDRLRKLEVKADDRRKALHEPHKAEIKKLDGLWNPVRDMAAGAKERLKLFVVTPFLKAQTAEADRLRAEAAKQGDTSPQTAAAIDRTVRTVAGQGGRATALRTYKSAKITDYAKTLAHFAENEKVKELIQKLADADVRAGNTPAGCEIFEDQRAA